MHKIDKYYLLVTFGKELESDGNGNEGRRMILKDISGENTYYYGWFGPPERTLLLFEEEAIEVIKNKLNVYSQGSSQSDFILDCNPNVIGEYEGTILFDDNFFDQYGALIYNLVVNNDVPIISSDGRSPQKEVYLILDTSEAPQQKENKVLRTLATGQSDITRHEAYTKATGLNEFNSLTPVYNSSANLEELMNQISEILSEYEISLSDLCVSSTWYNNKSCGILSITQNWTKIVSNELPPQVMIFSGEFTDDDKLNAKSFEGFDKVTSSSNQVSISKEDAIKLADLVIKACKQGYRLRVMVK